MLKPSNSWRRVLTRRFTSPRRLANSSGRISTRPASESTFQTRCPSFSSSDRLTTQILTRLALTSGELVALFFIFASFASSSLVYTSLLVPEVGISQILIQFGPEQLVTFARIHAGSGHGEEALFTFLPFRCGDLIDSAPDVRVRAARDAVLRNHSPVFENEVAPHQPPVHFSKDGGLESGRGGKPHKLAFFRRPIGFSAQLLCREGHD